MRALFILCLFGFGVGMASMVVSILEQNETKLQGSILLALLYFTGGIISATKLDKK